MSKQMIVNASAAEEIRVAIVENNRLADLDIEVQSRAKSKGNIYKGIVANVEDSLEAAFIEFGDDKQAFLALSEVRPDLYPEKLRGKKRPKISDILQRGQEIVVQVTKDEIGQKGAAVTTYLSLPGRYVVLMHSDDGGGGISRKIDDEGARKRARSLLSRIDVPDGMAIIIRTAGMHRPQVDLLRDLKALARAWEQIDRGAQLGRAPTLLYREPDLVVRTIRDYLAPDVNKIVIDSEEEFEEVRSYFEDRMPDLLELVHRHEAPQPIFESYGIERAIEELYDREVSLPAGGSISIDQTEALVAVDVNSGKSTREADHEATVYKTNLEAAKELARQLRLRDLGGIIVVDFIDMASRKHERDVERAIRDAMRADKARVKIGRISENGTLELTRQRLRQAHRLISHAVCTACEGTGRVRDPAGLAVGTLRAIQSRLTKAKNLARLRVKVPVAVANVLSNKKRRDLMELQDEHRIEVFIEADMRLHAAEIKFEEERRGKAGLDAATSVKDPRLSEKDGRRGRRGRRNRRDEPVQPLASQPPPSIGAPPMIPDDAEEALLRDEADELAREQERGQEPAETKTETVETPQHFDDPLTEALFGTAPEMELEEAEIPAAEVVDLKPRRKRRRRRGRRRNGEDGENGESASDDSRDGQDSDGDAQNGDDSGAGDEKVARDDAQEDKPKRSRRSRGRGRRNRDDREANAKDDDSGAEPTAESASHGDDDNRENRDEEDVAAKGTEDDVAPKKKRASRARKKPEENDAQEATAPSDDTPDDESEAAPKKKRASRAKKAPAKKVADGDANGVTPEDGDAPPKKKRASRAKKVETDDAAEAPPKKKRASRAKKVETDDAAETEAPAKKKRASRAKKKDDAEENAAPAAK